MEVNSAQPQNNNVAAATTNVVNAQQQQSSAKQVNPAKASAESGGDIRNLFNQEDLIRDAIAKEIITGETELFNFRVTRYDDGLTFTNIENGTITSAPLSSVARNGVVDGTV